MLLSIFDLSNDTDNPLHGAHCKGPTYHTCGTLMLSAPKMGKGEGYYCGLCDLQGWLKRSARFPQAEWF